MLHQALVASLKAHGKARRLGQSFRWSLVSLWLLAGWPPRSVPCSRSRRTRTQLRDPKGGNDFELRDSRSNVRYADTSQRRSNCTVSWLNSAIRRATFSWICSSDAWHCLHRKAVRREFRRSIFRDENSRPSALRIVLCCNHGIISRLNVATDEVVSLTAYGRRDRQAVGNRFCQLTLQTLPQCFAQQAKKLEGPGIEIFFVCHHANIFLGKIGCGDRQIGLRRSRPGIKRRFNVGQMIVLPCLCALCSCRTKRHR